jgi:hypothetical protein
VEQRPTVDPDPPVLTVDADPLPARLLRWARGVPGMETAVRDLVASPWLDDDGFVDECVVPIDGDGSIAVVDWAAAGTFLARGPAGDLTGLRRAIDAARSTWV